MSDDGKQDVLIMTGNLSLDAALALVVSQQNEIEALKDKYERLKATHIETAKESSLREADNQDLRAEVATLRVENETHKEIAVRETMKVATLRAALKPFAERANWYDINCSAHEITCSDEYLPCTHARTVLEETGNE